MLIICILLTLNSCASKKDVFEENNTIFFQHLLNRLEQDEVDIYSVDAYYLDNWYYYRVSYSYVSPLTAEWQDIELVYFGNFQVDRYFNPNWTNWAGLEQYRDSYYAAVEKGEHKSFSQEEIKQYVESFYSSK